MNFIHFNILYNSSVKAFKHDLNTENETLVMFWS